MHKPLSRQEIWPQTEEPFIIFSLFFFNVSVIQFSLFPKISPNLYYLSHGEKPHIFVDVQGDKASQFYTCHALGEPPVGGREKPGEASEKLAGVPDVSFRRCVRDVMLCHRFWTLQCSRRGLRDTQYLAFLCQPQHHQPGKWTFGVIFVMFTCLLGRLSWFSVAWHIHTDSSLWLSKKLWDILLSAWYFEKEQQQPTKISRDILQAIGNVFNLPELQFASH